MGERGTGGHRSSHEDVEDSVTKSCLFQSVLWMYHHVVEHPLDQLWYSEKAYPVVTEKTEINKGVETESCV